MDFKKLENMGKKAFQRFPRTRRMLKRVYQQTSYALSKDKIRCEGDIVQVTPSDGYEYFFGYYDKSPWDADDRFMITLKVKCAYKSPAPKEPGELVLVDTANNNTTETIAITRSWNSQQGCMAQWLGPDFKSRIIYNDFRDGHYCSVVFNVEANCEEKVYGFPIYDVSKDGTYALSLDFSRLHRLRPGYGYSNLVDSTASEFCPDKPCIWKIDLKSGEVTELLKYTDFADFEPNSTMNGAEHKVNHLMISPDGGRFMVLHRWFDCGKKHTRLITSNVDGSDMYNLSDDVFVSHCYWKSNNRILAFLRKKETGDHYYLIRDKAQECKLLWPELDTDGHCSYSPDGSHIITDTYPNRQRIASVFLCKENGQTKRLARVFSPFRYDNDCRCDLHPRWNHAGDKVSIDSVHEGKTGLYVISLKAESDVN
jgi:hypothetical protein